MSDIEMIKHLLQNHWNGFVRSIPSIIIGIIILFVALVLARIAANITRKALRDRIENSLLLDVIARAVGSIIFLLGVYLIFEMANLTGAALTIISGTGVIGIILGIAFRDITENFLASILLSINHPFRTGDLVEIANFTGYVRGLTMRVTILMSAEGHHIQIPNALVFKSHIRNFSSNPNRREDFSVSISYENSISYAQEVALKMLENHEAVLKNPEPMVLVENLTKNSVDLRIYFWLDGHKHSWQKVKSSVIRLVKHAFHEAGVAMALDQHEILIQLMRSEKHKKIVKEKVNFVTEAESELKSQSQEIKDQADVARNPENGKNLL